MGSNEHWLDYDNLEALKKYADTVCDVRIVLFKLDDKGNDSGYIELNIDTKIATTPDVCFSLIFVLSPLV